MRRIAFVLPIGQASCPVGQASCLPTLRRSLFFLAFAFATFAHANVAAQEADQRVRIARLIRTLGSESFHQRQSAHDELAKLGTATRAQLEAALDSDDPEVRLQAGDLLERIRLFELWEPSYVRQKCDEEPAKRVLDAVSTQTGNMLLIGDQYGAFNDEPVSLDFASAPFWQAMDELCRQSGNHVRPHYDTRNPGLVVVAGDPGKFPVAYAGPVRAQLTSARRVFIEELNYEDLDSETTHTFQLNLQMMWEDRFRLVAYQSGPTLAEAVTDTGMELSATKPSGSGWNVANPGTRQLSMNLGLHPPDTTAKTLAHMELKWGLIAVGDMAVFEIDDLKPGTKHQHENVELELVSLDKRQGSRYDLTVVIARDWVVPEPQEVLFHENDFDLLDAAGTPFRRQGQTNSLSDGAARLKISFIGPSADSEPQKLRVTYPRLRDQRELSIVFTDVPLPVARPE